MQLDNGYEVMKCVSPKSSETRSVLEDCTSPYLLLKEPSAPSLGGTVNLILSFTNSGDSQLQVQEADQEEVGESSEAVHRVSITPSITLSLNNPARRSDEEGWPAHRIPFIYHTQSSASHPLAASG